MDIISGMISTCVHENLPTVFDVETHTDGKVSLATNITSTESPLAITVQECSVPLTHLDHHAIIMQNSILANCFNAQIVSTRI